MNRLKDLINASFFRFIIVGVINTLVGSAIMFGLYNLAGCSFWVSSSANYILTSILSFFLNKYFTFQNHNRSFGQIVRFALNIAVCYLLAYGIAQPLCERMLSGYSETIRGNISLLVGMGLFTVFNYAGQRLLVFRDRA